MKIKDLIFKINSLNYKEVLEYCIEKANKKGEKSFIVTINPEIIMLAKSDYEYERVLKSADLALADGVGVVWAVKLFGKSFKGRVHGVDLVESLCRGVSKQPITVGFLGGYGNVAQRTAECLVKKYPGLKVAFAVEEWDFARGPATRFPPASAHSRFTDSALSGNPSTPVTPRKEFINHKSPASPDASPASPSPSQGGQGGLIINHQSCNILFVAFGSPKQEEWISQNLQKIDVRVAIGVGGAFDFISGKVARAPLWIRNLGLEWLFRLIRQPWRAKRQIALVKFVFLVIKEKLF